MRNSLHAYWFKFGSQEKRNRSSKRSYCFICLFLMSNLYVVWYTWLWLLACVIYSATLHSLAVFWLKTSACKCYTVYLFAEEPDCMFRQFLAQRDSRINIHMQAYTEMPSCKQRRLFATGSWGWQVLHLRSQTSWLWCHFWYGKCLLKGRLNNTVFKNV